MHTLTRLILMTLSILAYLLTRRKRDPELRVLVYRTRGETYILTYDGDSEPEAHRVLGRWACDPELSFDLSDACEVSGRIDQMEARRC